MAAVLTDRSGLVLRLYSLKMSRYIVNWQHMPSILCSLCLKKRAFYGSGFLIRIALHFINPGKGWSELVSSTQTSDRFSLF